MLIARPISRRLVVLAIAFSLTLAAPRAIPAAQAASEQTRARAWDALLSRLKEQKYLDHSLAVEAIMSELAVAEGDDRGEWGVAGLLHDIDIGDTAGDLSRHGLIGARILRDLGFSQAVVHAVSAHDDRPGVARTSRLDHALYCADQVYWLAAATGHRFQSSELNIADPESLWEQVQGIPSKQAILEKVSAGCAAISFSMPRALAAVQAASRKLSAKPAARENALEPGQKVATENKASGSARPQSRTWDGPGFRPGFGGPGRGRAGSNRVRSLVNGDW